MIDKYWEQTGIQSARVKASTRAGRNAPLDRDKSPTFGGSSSNSGSTGNLFKPTISAEMKKRTKSPNQPDAQHFVTSTTRTTQFRKNELLKPSTTPSMSKCSSSGKLPFPSTSYRNYQMTPTNQQRKSPNASSIDMKMQISRDFKDLYRGGTKDRTNHANSTLHLTMEESFNEAGSKVIG